MLRIVFMGSPEFALPSLKLLAASSNELVAVASNPDRRRGRRGKPEPTPVKACALELGLPVLDVESVSDEGFKNSLKELKPDLLVIVAFRILPASILEIPSVGSVNLHASLLPKYRGAAPIHHAILNGEAETGCSIFFLEESVDTGSVISRSKTAIGPNETTGDLYNRLKEAGAKLLLHSIDSIDRGEVNAVPQDHALATPAPKVYKKDGELDFSRSAEEVHNRIRAFNPVPGAWSVYDGKRLNIYRSHRLDGVAGEPGQLSISNGRLVVSCGSGSLEMIELQMAGGKRLSGVEFSNGFDSNRKLGGPLGNSG